MKNCFNIGGIVCCFCDNIITYTLQQVYAGNESFWFTDSGTPGSGSETSATDEWLACCWFYFNFVFTECVRVLSFLQGAVCSAYRVNGKMPVPPPPPPPGPPPPPTLALVSGCELINDIITVFPLLILTFSFRLTVVNQ